MISSLFKYKINIIIIIFIINLIINFIIKNESKFYRILNLFYGLIWFRVIFIKFSEINKDKDKKHIEISSVVYDKLKDIRKKEMKLNLLKKK